jgi:methyl-accepting chemotaxis protein
MIFGIALPVFICFAVRDYLLIKTVLDMSDAAPEVIRPMIVQSVILFVFCIAIMLAAIILTAGFAVRQIRTLTGYALNLASGNTDFKVATARRQDEFGVLGRAVREIQLSLKKISLLLQYAARAGVHGKGFAVVAEEVKNLANKSAAAAKETSQLLSESIQRSRQSMELGEEMETALSEIVDSIGVSAASIMEIADDCMQQVYIIEQLNTGLEQISQVVTNNTSTAQESAAASHEMAAQSAMLMEMVSNYKIDVTRVVVNPTGFNENDY